MHASYLSHVLSVVFLPGDVFVFCPSDFSVCVFAFFEFSALKRRSDVFFTAAVVTPVKPGRSLLADLCPRGGPFGDVFVV